MDVHTVRSVIDNGDGSVDPFGELLDIAEYSQQEFDTRDIDWIKGTGRGPVQQAVGGGGSDTGGRTFAEIFSDYKEYGIEYDSNTVGLGNVYYQGRLVKTFIDENNDGGIFTLSSIDGGDIVVRTVYDANGKLTGVIADN